MIREDYMIFFWLHVYNMCYKTDVSLIDLLVHAVVKNFSFIQKCMASREISERKPDSAVPSGNRRPSRVLPHTAGQEVHISWIYSNWTHDKVLTSINLYQRWTFTSNSHNVYVQHLCPRSKFAVVKGWPSDVMSWTLFGIMYWQAL